MSSSHIMTLEIPAPSLLVAAAADPSSIDKLLRFHILDADLPKTLAASISESVNRCITPESTWGGDPSRSPRATYDAFINAALLGRAYALLAGTDTGASRSYLGDLEEGDYVGQEWSNASGTEPDWQKADVRQRRKALLRAKLEGPVQFSEGKTDTEEASPLRIFSMLPVELRIQIYQHYKNRLRQRRLFSTLPMELRIQIYQHYKNRLRQRRLLWSIISSTFIKALFSGADPEPLSRYCAGILILTCGHALSRTRHLIGKGKHWIWWCDEIEHLDHFWTWPDLVQAINQTDQLPRNTWDVAQLMGLDPKWATAGQSREYVPQDVLDVLDKAREHLWKGAMDHSSEEIVTDLLPNLNVDVDYVMDALDAGKDYVMGALDAGKDYVMDTVMAVDEQPPPFSTTSSSTDTSQE